MLQGGMVFILVVVGLSSVLGAGYLLFRRGWFWTWFKASFAMYSTYLHINN
jgi:CHASE2 domain-containing sensor protein